MPKAFKAGPVIVLILSVMIGYYMVIFYKQIRKDLLDSKSHATPSFNQAAQ